MNNNLWKKEGIEVKITQEKLYKLNWNRFPDFQTIKQLSIKQVHINYKLSNWISKYNIIYLLLFCAINRRLDSTFSLLQFY